MRLSVLVFPTRRDSKRRCRSRLCKRHGLKDHNSVLGSLNSYRFIGTSDDLWRAGINTTDVRALASRRKETGIRELDMHRIIKKKKKKKKEG